MDINKIVVSNEVTLGKKDFKYFIGYKDAKIIKHSCIFFPKVTAYKKDFDKDKCMSFSEEYLKIWEKVSNNIKKQFNSEPVYSKKYLNTGKKIDEEKVNTKKGFQSICISIILINSVFFSIKLVNTFYKPTVTNKTV